MRGRNLPEIQQECGDIVIYSVDQLVAVMLQVVYNSTEEEEKQEVDSWNTDRGGDNNEEEHDSFCCPDPHDIH